MARRPHTTETMSLMTEAAIDAIAAVNQPLVPAAKRKKKKGSYVHNTLSSSCLYNIGEMMFW